MKAIPPFAIFDEQAERLECDLFYPRITVAVIILTDIVAPSICDDMQFLDQIALYFATGKGIYLSITAAAKLAACPWEGMLHYDRAEPLFYLATVQLFGFISPG